MSGKLEIHQGAFCVGGKRIDRRTTSFGLYNARGFVLPQGQIRTSSWMNRPAGRVRMPGDATRLFGPALFAGSVDKQFGFVLLNSLGRLWALEQLPPETVVLFGAKPVASAASYKFVHTILRALGLPNPILILHEGNVVFDRLHIAEELFGEATGGKGSPEFYQWLDRRWPAAARPDPARRIYVTRSALGPGVGRIACEHHLEALLASEGYEIYAPEAHPLTHQVATLQGAGKLIFAEGSALHLFALLRRPGQISAVIHRRTDLPEIMRQQMADREGSPTSAINAVREHWWPPRRGDHLGVAVLDFDLLREQLREAGLINGDGWRVPTADEEAQSLAAGLLDGERLMTFEERGEWLRNKRQG